MSLHPKLAAITASIRERSRPTRQAYLEAIARTQSNGPQRTRLSCGNLAHGFAACAPTDKLRLRGEITPNLGIISAYNDVRELP